MTEWLVQSDSWLTECLKFPCYAVSETGDQKLTEILHARAGAFVTAKVSTQGLDKSKELEALGFAYVNDLEKFHWQKDAPVPTADPNCLVEIEQAVKVKTWLLEFAALFSADRFHQDTRLPQNWSKKIKSAWIDTDDDAKQCAVAYVDSKVAGFILFKQSLEKLVIELVAVQPEFQGRGVGRQLLGSVQKHCVANSGIVVGTQNDNLAAKMLYASMGFQYVDRKRVYHFYSAEMK